MREYWDARADEDAMFFVDNRLRYGEPDEAAFWAGGEQDFQQILEILGQEIEPGDDVVEIGCGVGRITRVLAAHAATVRALDVSQRMLELAQEHNPSLENVSWLLGDGSSLTGVADRSADVCFSHVVFQHIPDPAITLEYVKEMGRVLRPGGWTGFHVSSAPKLHDLRLGDRLRLRLKGAIGRGPRGQAHPSWLGSAVDLDELRTAAAGAGLETEHVFAPGTQWCLVLLRKL